MHAQSTGPCTPRPPPRATARPTGTSERACAPCQTAPRGTEGLHGARPSRRGEPSPSRTLGPEGARPAPISPFTRRPGNPSNPSPHFVFPLRIYLNLRVLKRGGQRGGRQLLSPGGSRQGKAPRTRLRKRAGTARGAPAAQVPRARPRAGSRKAEALHGKDAAPGKFPPPGARLRNVQHKGPTPENQRLTACPALPCPGTRARHQGTQGPRPGLGCGAAPGGSHTWVGFKLRRVGSWWEQ